MTRHSADLIAAVQHHGEVDLSSAAVRGVSIETEGTAKRPVDLIQHDPCLGAVLGSFVFNSSMTYASTVTVSNDRAWTIDRQSASAIIAGAMQEDVGVRH
jgi:hypothetical protein